MKPGAILQEMFEAAVEAASPDICVPIYLPPAPKGRTIVVGAGKAAAAMARAVEDNWPGDLSGLVVTRHGHAVPCRRIEVVEAAHPIPDSTGQDAAQRILHLVSDLTEDDLVLCLISGGGSALLALPAPGITLEDKQSLTAALLKSGAAIGEINTIRKHLSAIKGGRLAAAAAPAKVVTLAISDVPGDDISLIASGPAVADASTNADARAVLDKYGLTAPALSETPKHLPNARATIVAKPQHCLEEAAAMALEHGVLPLVLGDCIEGEAREVARVMAGIARSVKRHGHPVPAPAVLVSGGETTVTIRGQGRGGRNTEFLLALAIALDGAPGIHALACDTDGIDGSQDNAGARITPDSLARAAALGLDAKAMLAANDSHGFFQALGDLIETGPTLTNVNDFRAILIE